MGIRLDKSRSPSAGVRKHVYEASKHRKVVDTEDVHNISRRDGKTGKVTSETVRTEKREVGKTTCNATHRYLQSVFLCLVGCSCTISK